MFYYVWDVPLFMFMGAVGGLMGAGFCHFNVKITQLRHRCETLGLDLGGIRRAPTTQQILGSYRSAERQARAGHPGHNCRETPSPASERSDYDQFDGKAFAGAKKAGQVADETETSLANT